ncbi:MAG TPA: hypothetical protein PLY87_27870 [Planctomycetaceae bacterium]|nr:hypothetical protein [Planctomycetaceae bacterium]HQZ68949.1 hypothetical protein [Planctomycetaceae bacterium]
MFHRVPLAPVVRTAFLGVVLLLEGMKFLQAEEPLRISGIYPHLAMFNNENECGTGAVVPWAGRLWVVTYAPHMPRGSSDKLYEITPELKQIVRPESIGGTPANRMIHPESQQLFIGPYAIDGDGHVRAIPYEKMFGRPTGNSRHLTDPAGKIYYATMEEGLYEVDVRTLEVTELWADEQLKTGRHSNLPGYHGKGLYSGQGRIVYANNGEHGGEAMKRPEVPSGVLAEWDGVAEEWTIVRRNQFTEVTGPTGIMGGGNPDDPIWSIGWDHRSLILMCLDAGQWHSYRLPKTSHSYDGAHGWNTEWPRIRDIGEDDLLMTMHGMFWKFPRTFRATSSAGIRPRSSYLKVVGDFCRWQDRVVLGCDDTAKSEFMNKRKAKGEIAPPQSQSNLWFLEPGQLDHLGPVNARGAVWLNDDIAAATPSDPFLFSGFDRRSLHLIHETDSVLKVRLEVDESGDGIWRKLRDVELSPNGHLWLDLSDEPSAAWIRLSTDKDAKQMTAWFCCFNVDSRTGDANAIFDGLAEADTNKLTGGVIRARGENKRTLHYIATKPGSAGTPPIEIGLYELDGSLKLTRTEDAAALAYQKTHAAIPVDVLSEDDASVIFVDDSGHRWRLPKGSPDLELTGPLGPSRVCREVATERDLFNAAGTFFELPAENAGGFARVRAVATHNRQIMDYCSYRGLLILSGVSDTASSDNPHLIRSDDGLTSLWAGAIDDVWQLGKPRGTGGPWKNTAVKSGEPSDAYLMNGYDGKTLTLSHAANSTVTIRIECDITGNGFWVPHEAFEVSPGRSVEHTFPAAFSAYWVRAVCDADCTASAQLVYE